MDKQIVLHPHKGILLRNKKELTTQIHATTQMNLKSIIIKQEKPKTTV